MDYEYTQCLNPILARINPVDKDILNLYHMKKINIIGNLRKLSKNMNQSAVLSLLADDNVIKLPCRKCINCALKKSKEWSTRNCLESRDYDTSQCWFITLTYDNDKLKTFDNKHFSLSKNHLSNFLKSLRAKYSDSKIRFFASGEYGSHTFRPHYHILIYGLNLKSSELEFLYRHKNFDYYKCQSIEKLWNKGICVVCNFEEFEANYVSQYTTKKIYEFKNPYFYQCNNMIPSFIEMSRRPGIADNYYNNHKEEFYKKNNDTLIFHQDFKTVHIKPFTFFDNKYDIDSPEFMNFLKENRKIFANQNEYFTTHELMIPIYQFLSDTERKVKKCKERSRDYEKP